MRVLGGELRRRAKERIELGLAARCVLRSVWRSDKKASAPNNMPGVGWQGSAMGSGSGSGRREEEALFN